MKQTTKDKILYAALTEFADKGYKLASTNTIHQLAGVSKGAIYSYFTSKADLFYHLFEKALTDLVEALGKVRYEADSVFDKIVYLSLWKIHYFHDRPKESALLMEAFANPPPPVKDKIFSHYEQLTLLTLENLFQEIDMNEFDSSYSKSEVIHFLKMALNGLQSEYIKADLTVEKLYQVKEESMKYINTLLKGMKK
ncbi:MAG: TetR/AcrR family transcriptional regulator [Bacilli bacterium]|jgi:AcrR family transcriptional regulator|nr:TetR/AcrR family transcriptional regulator [Bacilli bacterium]MDY0064510.1 TetR/AcrR family transcriptional regulator [Bacilli bacterium]